MAEARSSASAATRIARATGALRKWASRLFDAGFISIDDLQRPPAECFATAGARPVRGNMPSQRNMHGARDAQK